MQRTLRSLRTLRSAVPSSKFPLSSLLPQSSLLWSDLPRRHHHRCRSSLPRFPRVSLKLHRRRPQHLHPVGHLHRRHLHRIRRLQSPSRLTSRFRTRALSFRFGTMRQHTLTLKAEPSSQVMCSSCVSGRTAVTARLCSCSVTSTDQRCKETSLHRSFGSVCSHRMLLQCTAHASCGVATIVW